MAGVPPPAMGVLTFQTVRALTKDLPEDFVDRVESGVDPETMSSLARGLRVARTMTRLNRIMYALLAAGAFAGIAGLGLLAFGAHLGWWLFGFALVSGIASVACLLASYALYLLHFRDMRRLEAFVRAARQSSLARDLG